MLAVYDDVQERILLVDGPSPSRTIDALKLFCDVENIAFENQAEPPEIVTFLRHQGLRVAVPEQLKVGDLVK